MIPAIKKSTVSFTVLHTEYERLEGMSLEQILAECDEGGFVGAYHINVETEDVPPENVELELFAVGNDGDFFNLLYGD
jgi:hypothetical protein